MRSRPGANRVIVTCAKCETSFQLDDSRVPAEGIRVRCSRCKEAFFLQHPSASQEEAVEEVVSQALDDAAGTAPEPAADLDTKTPAPEVVGSDDAIQSDDDESDWEFNVDPVAAEEDEGENDPDAALNFGTVRSDGGSGLSLEGEAEPELEAEAEAEAESVMAPEDLEESAFGSMDDYESEPSETIGEEDLIGDSPLEIGDVSGLGTEQPGVSLGESLGESMGGSVGESASEPSQMAAPTDTEEAADSDNWDFFSDDAPDPAAADPGGDKAVLGRINLTSVEAGSDGLASDTAFGPAGGLQDGAYGTDDEEPSKLWLMTAQLGHAVGWLGTVVMIALGVAVGLEPTAESLADNPRSVSFGDLRVDNITGHWIDTANATTRYVVTAELSNPTERAVVLDPPPRVALKTATGRGLDDASPGWLGVAVAESELRELGENALGLHRGAAAAAFSRTPLQPGERRPFQVVYEAAPNEVVDFEFVSTRVETTALPQLKK